MEDDEMIRFCYDGGAVEKSLLHALYQLLHIGLDQFDGSIAGYQFPTRLDLTVCRGVLHWSFEGPEQEMRQLFKALILYRMLEAPRETWGPNETKERELFDHLNMSDDLVDQCMRDFCKRSSDSYCPVTGMRWDGLRANIALLLVEGVTAQQDLEAGAVVVYGRLEEVVLPLWQQDRTTPFSEVVRIARQF